jgi:WhiB family transcriptional regulator, redox-sensing transcriptional regulator
MHASRNTRVQHARWPLDPLSGYLASLSVDDCFPAPWGERGLCVGENPEIFFPAHGDPGEEARRVCALCSVRARCLEYAIGADEFGVWGGLDQDERRALRMRNVAARSGNARSAGLTR